MRFRIYPYKMASDSADELNEALPDCLKVYPDGKYVPHNGDVIFNWGNGHCPAWIHKAKGSKFQIINHWSNVCLAINKIESFKLFKKHGISTPDWSESAVTADNWLKKGEMVFGRKRVEATRGESIEIFKKSGDLTNCRLYVKFQPHQTEYRVYVFNGKVIDVLEKRKKHGAKHNELIKSEEGGWVFCRQHVHMPPSVGVESIAAVGALGLDFGGVDVLWDGNNSYVLEVNTAPGIFGTTVPRLVKALKEFVEE